MNNSAKIGLSFPLLVIAGAVIIGVVGFGVLYGMHERSNINIRSPKSLESVEGKLIEELYRKTNAEMILKDTEIAMQKKRINELLARKMNMAPAEAAKLNNEIEESEKQIANLEADKEAIMENYWKEIIKNVPPDTPVQIALDQLLEENSINTPLNTSIYDQIIEQLREENLNLTETIDKKDRELALFSAQLEAYQRSRGRGE